MVNDILVNQENIKVVNIERDVKDVLVSHYYHLLNNKKIKSNFTDYFNSWGKYKAIQYIYYKKKWANYNFCLNLKYEDLINNKKDIILKIATYLDVKCDHIDNIINETSIESLRKNSKAKGLNESNWFYRKGEVGDWQNFFSEYMLKKLSLIEQNHLSIFEKINFFFKFTFRISIKYFLYRYFPSLYILFDKKF